jgi:hypothetical protein
LCNIARNKVAVWGIHAGDDATPTDESNTINAVNAVNSCASVAVLAKNSIYADGGHSPVVRLNRASDTTNKLHYPNI